jgi:hypothetical protein
LTDRGIDASSAGTSLRNIFLKLAKDGLTWDQAMEKVNSSTDRLKTAVEVFGVRASTAGIVIAETAESTDMLTTSLENASGAAKEMADTMLDNLAGDMTIAQSTWEGFVLSLEDGNGVISRGLRTLTQGFINLFEQLKMLNEGQDGLTSTQKEAFGFNRKLNQMWESMTQTLQYLSTEEGKRHEALKLANVLHEKLGKSQAKLNKARELGAPQQQLNALGATVQLYQGLLDKLKPYVGTYEEANEVIEENTVITKENNKAKQKTVDLLKDEEKLIDEVFQKELELSTQKKAAAIAQAEFDKQKQEERINALFASEAFKNERLEQLEREHQTKLAAIDKEFAIEALKPKGEEDPFAALNEQLAKEAEIKREAREQELLEEAAQAEAIKNIKDAFVSEATSFASDVFAQEQDQKLDLIKDQAEIEKAILQDRLDKGLIAQADFDKEIKKINKKTRREEAKASRRKALFDIAINTGVAVVKALPNFIAAAAVVALGAIQAAFVAARPLPSFAKGEVDIKGKRHSAGGIKAEIEGGESVINRMGTANAPELLKGINNGLIKDNDLSALSPNQKESLMASLYMQGDKQLQQNEQIISLLRNNGYSFEQNGFVVQKMADGTEIKTPKITPS